MLLLLFVVVVVWRFVNVFEFEKFFICRHITTSFIRRQRHHCRHRRCLKLQLIYIWDYLDYTGACFGDVVAYSINFTLVVGLYHCCVGCSC